MPKRSFEVAFKLQVVEFAKSNSNEATARQFSIDSKQVRTWKQQKDQLIQLAESGNKRKNLPGQGRKFPTTCASQKGVRYRLTGNSNNEEGGQESMTNAIQREESEDSAERGSEVEEEGTNSVIKLSPRDVKLYCSDEYQDESSDLEPKDEENMEMVGDMVVKKEVFSDSDEAYTSDDLKDKNKKSNLKIKIKYKGTSEKKKRGRKREPRRLDGRDDIISDEEDFMNEEVPIRFGTGYHVLFKMKVLKYAGTHSTTATAEKFKLRPKLVREWRRQQAKIEIDCNSSQRRQRNDGYTVQEKLHAIKFAEERSIDEARLLYDVDRRTIEKWRANIHRLEARLQNGQGDSLRESGSGCKPKYRHIEDKLRDWIVGLRLKGVTVTTKMILTQASKLHEDHESSQSRKAPSSHTWVVNFLKRYNLYTLLGTTLGHEDPREILTTDLVKGAEDFAELASKIDEIPDNPNKRNRRRITMEDKINIIQRIERGETQGTVAKSLGAATSTIQTIWSSRNEIIRKSQTPTKSKSNTLFWRKYSVIAAALQDWYDQCLLAKQVVNAKALTEKALQFSSTYKLLEFSGECKEWLKIFCKRRNLKEVLAEFNNCSQLPQNSSREARPSPTEFPVTTNVPDENTNSPSCDPHPESDSAIFDDLVRSCDSTSQPSKGQERERPTPITQQYTSASSSHSSSDRIQQSCLVPDHQTTNSTTSNVSNSQLNMSSQMSTLYSHYTEVTHLEAVKSIASLRSWIIANYGPHDIGLNEHLFAIECAVMKRRPT